MPTARWIGAGTTDRMTTTAALLGGAAFGAGALLLFGPGGRRRRARLRDRGVHLRRAAAAAAQKGARDLRGRTQGLLPHRHREDTGDPQLVERVRATLGRCCSHAHAVHVDADHGVVTLTGDVLDRERSMIIDDLARVAGVERLVDGMQGHRSAGGVPALQGAGKRPGAHAHERWTPASRLLAIGAGGALVAVGLGVDASPRIESRMLKLSAAGLVVGGGALALRALADERFSRALTGPFTLQRSLLIRAPLEQVFGLFTSPHRFPLFMRHVRGAERIDDTSWRITVDAPLGGACALECEVVRQTTNELIEWRSERDRFDGALRFRREGDGTRVDVEMSLRPALGVLEMIAGRAPKRMLDDDLLRLKSLLENKKATGRAGQVTLEEVTALTQ